MTHLSDRALTNEQKREVVERLLAAWEKSPTQRLTQFLYNATYKHTSEALNHHVHDNYNVEDFELVREAEEFVSK